MNKPLISIVIPTYNGLKTLPEIIDNILAQITSSNNSSQIEIAITDDDSIDGTKEYLKSLKKSKFISVFFNKTNLGMDKNFQKAAINASGEYVWFFGQDDLLKESTLKTIINILETHSLGQLYIDYEQYSEKKKSIVCSSMIDLQSKRSFNQPLMIFNSAKEYFSYMDDAPSFLPATIMKRSYLLDKRLKQFTGTHYVQYSAFVLNLNGKLPTGVYKKVLVRGIIPKDGWQESGTKLFEIAVGKLHAQYLLNLLDKRCLFDTSLREKKKRFIFGFPKLLLLSFNLSFLVSPQTKQFLYNIFDYVTSFFLITLSVIFSLLSTYFKK